MFFLNTLFKIMFLAFRLPHKIILARKLGGQPLHKGAFQKFRGENKGGEEPIMAWVR